MRAEYFINLVPGYELHDLAVGSSTAQRDRGHQEVGDYYPNNLLPNGLVGRTRVLLKNLPPQVAE